MDIKEIEKKTAIDVASPLLRKTKKELLEIILRKDAVERNLRSTINNLEHKYNDLNINYINSKRDISYYQRNLNNSEELYIKQLRKFSIIFSSIIILLIIIMVIMAL